LRTPTNGEVVVDTLWSGISAGTEMLAYRGEIDALLPLDESIGALGGTFTFPFGYGYSCVGRVTEPATDAGVPEGRLVFAFHPHQDRFVAAAGDLIDVDGVEPRLATMFPLVETALQVALDAGPVLDETVVVTGLGTVGLLIGLMLERAGARVLGVEPVEWRRTLAGRLGIETISPDELVPAVRDRSPGGLNLAVEVSGRPEVLRSLLPLLAHEGEAIVVSWYGTKEVPLPLGAEFHRRRLTIRSTQVTTIPASLSRRWDRARRLRATRRLLDELPLAGLATHDFAFESAPQAFAAVDEGRSGLMHAALGYG
jgi:2-desacetyl-2-hydroxyethyl bacteriochlorophyllide A dehydrogenase